LPFVLAGFIDARPCKDVAAKVHGLSAVTVDNLFSMTQRPNPRTSTRAAQTHGVIGERTNDVVVETSRGFPITVARWGFHGTLLGRVATSQNCWSDDVPARDSTRSVGPSST
jgi:hypothetical protein